VGVLRPEIYRVLRGLSFKGLVTRTPDSPTEYSATIPAKAFANLIGREERRLSTLKEKAKLLCQSLSAGVTRREIGAPGHFSVIAGGGNVLYRLIDMIRESESDYASIASKFGLRRMSGYGILGKEFARTIKSAQRRGVRIRVLSNVDASNQRNAVLLSKYVELRNLRELSIYFDIIDRRQMLMGPPIPDDEADDRNVRETDLWTNYPQFTAGMYVLFETLWTASKDWYPSAPRLGVRLR
jgi:sugar-specific transcriptional regulator TrmB